MLQIRAINDDLKEVAEAELNEVESRMPDDVAALRDWLAKQPHLRTRTDDQFLVTFLRGCKYSIEKAKSKLDHFYTIRTMIPEIFVKQRIDDHVMALCRTGIITRLPKPFGDGVGPRLQLTKFGKLNPKEFKLLDIFRYQSVLMQIHMVEDDVAVISGAIDIMDMANLSLSFLAQTDLMLIKKLGVFTDKASPLRLKGVYLVNCPKEVVTILNLAKSLMSPKLQSRMHVFKNFDDLYQVIPQKYFPIEYGGENGSVTEIQEATEKQLLSYCDYFKENDDYFANEKLRPGKHVDADSLFGIDGSFRKLSID